MNSATAIDISGSLALDPKRRRTALRLAPRRLSDHRPQLALAAVHVVWRAASSITRSTASGLEIRDRWDALIFVTVACARSAMNSCAAGGMAWSSVPITAQVGTPVQGRDEAAVGVSDQHYRAGDGGEVAGQVGRVAGDAAQRVRGDVNGVAVLLRMRMRGSFRGGWVVTGSGRRARTR